MTYTFYRDREDNYVYFADNSRSRSDLRLNGTIPFEPSRNCTLPMPRTLDQVRTKEVVTSYKRVDSDEIISAIEFERRCKVYEDIPENELSVEQEVEYVRLKREWEPIQEQQEIQKPVPFQVIDIEYPADHRLVPMRHLGEPEKANYFTVYGHDVAIAKAHELCRAAGLKLVAHEDRKGHERNTYYLDGNFYWWRIEGESYCEHKLYKVDKEFTGTLTECQRFISEVEATVQNVFDEWAVAYIEPDYLTVRAIKRALGEIESSVESIDPKVKTHRHKKSALQAITAMKELLREKARKALDSVTD